MMFLEHLWLPKQALAHGKLLVKASRVTLLTLTELQHSVRAAVVGDNGM